MFVFIVSQIITKTQVEIKLFLTKREVAKGDVLTIIPVMRDSLLEVGCVVGGLRRARGARPTGCAVRLEREVSASKRHGQMFREVLTEDVD